MKDLQTHLAKIRTDAAECHLLSNIATDGKRELFAKLAEHLNALAFEVEKTIAAGGIAEGAPRAQAPVSAPSVGGEGVEAEPKGHADVAFAADQKPTARPARKFPWLLVIASAAVAGAFIWVNHLNEVDASLVTTVQSKPEPSQAPQEDALQALAAVLYEQQRERKQLTEQLGALAARVDSLEKMRAEIAAPSTKQSVNAEEKPAALEAKPPISEDKPVRMEEKGSSSPERPAEADISNSVPKQSDGVPPRTGNSVIAPVDRLGAVPVPARAELDLRKPIGPAGCTHFRSFDPVSGTYTTFSGRRRECR
jgi:uncharacterized coiled-coil protein SlyX